MARQPRIDLAGIPQHIIQRGNNRQACFFDDIDRFCYLKWLRDAADRYGVNIHAYVLMTNHVHMLATGSKRGSISLMMQSLGRRYVRYVNTSRERTGTLWEGRYKSSLVDTDGYLFTCYRYIELNPVRAGMVETPGEHRWSSYRHNAHGIGDDLITPHALFLGLGTSKAERASAYQDLFRTAIEPDDIDLIRKHVNQGKALGSDKFRSQIEAILDRPVHLAAPGRPKKKVL